MLMVLASCRGGSDKPLLPNVSGKAGEVIVVMDKSDWDGNLGGETRGVLAADYPFLPQREPTFSIVNVPPTGFADLFKIHRNILIYNISQDVRKSGVVYRNDQWAYPQCVIQISAPSSDSAATLLKENGERIVNAIEQAERDRIIVNAKRYEAPNIAPVVQEMTGGSPNFPMGYRIRKKTDNFIWISDDKQYTTQGVFVYKYPASDKENFTEQNIIAHRNQFLKENVPVMNGRNPNFFWDGFHSEDDTRSQNEFSWRIGIDFIVSPAIIAMSRSTEDTVRMNMKTEERFCL